MFTQLWVFFMLIGKGVSKVDPSFIFHLVVVLDVICLVFMEKPF